MAFTLDELMTPTKREVRQKELYGQKDEEINPSCYDCYIPSFGHKILRGT